MKKENCTGLNGVHGYAEHECPVCQTTVCSDCAAYDSRGDHRHNGNCPILECPKCGENVLAPSIADQWEDHLEAQADREYLAFCKREYHAFCKREYHALCKEDQDMETTVEWGNANKYPKNNDIPF